MSKSLIFQSKLKNLHDVKSCKIFSKAHEIRLPSRFCPVVKILLIYLFLKEKYICKIFNVAGQSAPEDFSGRARAGGGNREKVLPPNFRK
jgi:hypothetical protein